MVSRLAARYDRSASAERLAQRLWLAQVGMTPATWRCAQLLMAVPVATTLIGCGASSLVALGVAYSLSRTGGAALLWARRHRSAAAIEAGTPWLARTLAAELTEWGNGVQAVMRAARRGALSPLGAARAPSRVLEVAAVDTLLGGDASAALRRALQSGVSQPSRVPSAATVIEVFSLHHHSSASTAAALTQLAGALEEEGDARRQAQAALGDVRMSTVAVPAIAAATGAILLSSDPPALAAALNPPLFYLLLGAMAVVAITVLGTRRMLAL
jgi:hypothetical protein